MFVASDLKRDLGTGALYCCASRSITMNPILCRVPAYWFPGFPSPTIAFIFAKRILAGQK